MPKRPVRQDGYSVVELLVAVTIFALVFAAVSIGIGRALEVNRGNRNRSAAAYLAARQLEEVRAKAFSSVALGRTTCVYTTTSCNLPSPYTVEEGERFASRYRAVDIGSECATFESGTTPFTLCEGEAVLK